MISDSMIAPCGLECAGCIHFLANTSRAAKEQIHNWAAVLSITPEAMLCGGCHAEAGQIPFQKHLFGKEHRCAIYACPQRGDIDYCGSCGQFPCDKRHPYSEKSGLLNKTVRAFLCV